MDGQIATQHAALREANLDLEAKVRDRTREIEASRETLARDTTWTSSTDTVFDGTYRHLLRAARAKAKENGA